MRTRKPQAVWKPRLSAVHNAAPKPAEQKGGPASARRESQRTASAFQKSPRRVQRPLFLDRTARKCRLSAVHSAAPKPAEQKGGPASARRESQRTASAFQKSPRRVQHPLFLSRTARKPRLSAVHSAAPKQAEQKISPALPDAREPFPRENSLQLFPTAALSCII